MDTRMIRHRRHSSLSLFTFLLFLALAADACAQDIEPRRWTHLPTGLNVIGVGTNYSRSDIFLDPVLQIEDAKSEVYAGGVSYVRSFGLAGKSARIDVLVPYAAGRWDGLLSGEPASTRRHGFADPRVRFSMLLYGAPALTMQEFTSQPRSNTVIGAAVSVKMPWGEYYPDRLINLGANRWMVRPQLGVTHVRGKWTWELTGSLFFYSDNDEFFGGTELENDELWALQGHAIYTFRPGLWASVSTAYGNGFDAFVDGVDRNLKVENWLLALSFGVPINRQQGLKFYWLGARTQNDTGSDIDSIGVGWSYRF
jgi:hypothetical protein